MVKDLKTVLVSVALAKRCAGHTRNMTCATAQVTTFSGKKLETGTHTTYYYGGKNLTL